ncbi:hypothetical protein O6H91_Y500500 [Diphasiastrum complanatum]|nr:hypothetical protein O6H91_Y503800 [Diphasiastrum complanatum]KAJ7198662.1 hypothetical protein O6H91_Y500500 [Diphasiastrum complanatum]
MGSRYKAAIFKEHIATALTDLHERIKNRKRDKHGSVHMDDTIHSQEGSKGLHSEGSSQQGEFGKHNVLQGKTDLKISLITGGETQHSEQKESSQQCEFGKHNVVQGKTDVEISLITGAETQNSEQKEMTELQKRYISNNLLHKVLQKRDSGATM